MQRQLNTGVTHVGAEAGEGNEHTVITAHGQRCICELCSTREFLSRFICSHLSSLFPVLALSTSGCEASSVRSNLPEKQKNYLHCPC